MATEDKFEHARENAKGWLESIEEMVDRLNHAQECKYSTSEDDNGIETIEDCDALDAIAQQTGNRGGMPSIDDCSEYHDQDKAREAIEESILDLTLSGEWHPGETPGASRYEILLTTGGPALRIVGDLDQYGEPSSAQMEMQDWGTGWEYFSMDHVLLTFAQQFYYGG